MNMYYKATKSNLSFNEDIDSFMYGYIIRLGDWILNPKDINIDDITFSINQINSNNWEIVDIDYDMMYKLNEGKDIMRNINLDIDSRFYNEEKMNISNYWDLFEKQFVWNDSNLQYEFMKFYANNYKK